MKDNYQSQLFSQIVETITLSIDNNINCENFNHLAKLLNVQGYRNARGREFTSDALRIYIDRVSHPKGFKRVLTDEIQDLRDRFFPTITPEGNLIDKNPHGFRESGLGEIGC